MKPDHSSENNEGDEEIIKRLQNLQASGPSYPPDLLKGRRAAFRAKVDELEQADAARELAPEDQEVVGLLGRLKAAQPTYPANLLAARRAAFLQQMGRAQPVSIWERLQRSVKGLFPSATGIPSVPSAPFRRTSLAIAVLMAAVWVGSLVFAHI